MTLATLFEFQAKRRPDHVALICDNISLSYTSLNDLACKWGHVLLSQGATKGCLIGLYLSRSVHAYAAILACHKIGAAYVPLDRSYPPERVQDISTDASLVFLVTEYALAERIRETISVPVLILEDVEKELHQFPSFLDLQSHAPAHNDLAYVIYTSGSTGRPKGVMIEHRNACHFVAAALETYGVNENDRIYQGFSLAFDASVEELWLAWGQGATLVAASTEGAKCPEDVADLIRRENVTIFSSVPTFLNLIEDPLPSVRIVITGGEVCPPELVSRLAPGRIMLNTYGPTEATVVATLSRCEPQQKVTIGRPLPGYTAHVVSETLSLTQPEQEGELLLGGPAIARGYLNRQELTAERFVKLPELGNGTFYRTGDRVRMDEKNNIEFLGRIDDQVKIRGFRVELSEIESVLREQPTIQTASVAVQQEDGIPILAAYVIREQKGEFTETETSTIAHSIRQRLAEYMIPKYLDVVSEFPTLPSGKINKALLPSPKSLLLRQIKTQNAQSDDNNTDVDKNLANIPANIHANSPANSIAHNPLELRIAAIWKKVFSMENLPSISENFFSDLGGHSLLAARVSTLLRREPEFANLSVRDIYTHPTISELASWTQNHVASQHPFHGTAGEQQNQHTTLNNSDTLHSSSDLNESHILPAPKITRFACYAGQGLTLGSIAALYAAITIVGLRIETIWQDGGISTSQLFIASIALFLLTPIFLLLVAISGKWLIMGRFRSGRYPLWGSMYLRFWIVSRLHAMSGASALSGTPLQNIYFRLMGSKIGSGVVLNSSLFSCFDVLTIGTGTSVGAETQVLGYRIEKGALVIAPTHIGKNCSVGIHSCIGLNTKMEDNSHLGDLSLLPDGCAVPQFEVWQGSPAHRIEKIPEDSQLAARNSIRAFLYSMLGWYSYYAFLAISAIPGFWIVEATVTNYGWFGVAVALPVLSIVTILTFCLTLIVTKNIVLKNPSPGKYNVDSIFFARKLFIDRLINLSRTLLLPLYATIYTPIWMRQLGAHVGRRAEISTVSSICPDLLTIDDECFLADGAIIGGMRLRHGFAEIARNHVGTRTFVGNSALLPTGVNLGSDCLVGCLSLPPLNERSTISGSKWLGSPAFLLPKLQPTETFDSSVIFKPTKQMIVQRGLIDFLRITLPACVNIGGILAWGFVLTHYSNLPFWLLCILMPTAGLFIKWILALVVVALKWLVMGRFQPTVKPLWCRYVWLNEMVNGLYEGVFAPTMADLLGSPFIVPFLRLLGMRIGRRTYIGSLLFSEFDLVSIGDDTALNMGATVQTHLFEDRIMKSSHLQIGSGCSIGNMSVVLYDTVMAPESRLGPLSLLMKGEHLSTAGEWTGIPCREKSKKYRS